MKRLVLIISIIFLIFIRSFAQDVSPLPSITVKKLIAPNNPVWYYDTADSALWVFKGETGWLKIASNSQLLKYYWSKTEITPADTTRWGAGSVGGNYVTGISVTGTTTKTITLTQVSGGTRTATFTDLTGGTTSGTFSQAYLNEADITSSTISVTFPASFPHINYALNLRAWYVDTVDSKAVQIAHSIYNFNKTVSGFSFKVDTVEGRYSYFAADTAVVYSSQDDRTKIVNEVPAGTINSINTAFTLAKVPNLNTQQLYMNGVRLTPTVDYTIASNNITMNDPPLTGYMLLADYSVGELITNEYYNEIPSGDINGINTIFTLVHSVSGTDISLFLNGVRQRNGIDFTISGNEITFIIAPLTDYSILADYKN